MPYIKKDRRGLFAPCILEVATRMADTGADRGEVATAGDLNYIISRIVREWIGNSGMNYAAINAAIGVLECAQLELYRTLAAPYEDQKIAENGPLPAV